MAVRSDGLRYLPYILLLLFLFAMIGSLSFKEGDHRTSSEGDGKILVLVNGDPITSVDVLRRIQAVHGEISMTDVNPSAWERLTEAAIESEILDMLLLQAAVREAYSVSPARIDEDLARTRSMLGEGAYKEMLEKRGVGEVEFRNYLKERILITRYRESLVGEIDLSEGKLEAYYEGHTERFALPERYRMHILVYNGPDEAERDKARSDKGIPFFTIAEEHLAAGGKSSRTRPMPADAIPGGMREVVQASAVGAVVRYDMTDSSYLIMILEKLEEEERPFNEVKGEVREYLHDIRTQKHLDEWYEGAVRQAKIENTRSGKDHGTSDRE